MSYYHELRQVFDDLALWVALRHEQGVAVAPVMRRFEKELKKAQAAMHKAAPTGKLLKKEPNDLASIKALRPEGPRRLWAKLNMVGLAERMKGAWLGRAAACTLGAPVENWSIANMERLAARCKMKFPPTDYWRQHPWPDEVRYNASPMSEYLKGNMTCVPVDDDLTYTLLGLLILEEYGPAFTVKDVGRAWLKYLPMACTAEHVALENLRAGVPASRAGEKNNPFQEWIGADIRSDPWGYAAPGWPEKAAEFAYRDAYLSHRQNGVYGEMYFSAAIAAAFAVKDPVDALEIALTEIPKECRLARDVRWALAVGPKLKDWRKARAAVDEHFKGMSSVHTNNNACLTIFGLLLGKCDFTATIGMTVAMGLDNDCTAATAGSILGAVIGAHGIPEHWWKPFRNRTRTYLNGKPWFSNMDIVARFVAVARRVWGEEGT